VYSVHEFAALAGVTVKTLHHYDRLGLLKPRRSAAGYRLYTDRDLERLEQIVALKFIGLPLKHIKVLLERSALPLSSTLRLRREALEGQRQRLDRAIDAIRKGERDIEAGQGSEAVLKKLIEVIEMQDEANVMKKYFSEEAWAKCRHLYEQGPSEEWRDLYRDARAAVGEDPAGERAQSLASRYLALMRAATGGDLGVSTGLIRAWIDRHNWPEPIKQKWAEVASEDVDHFLGEAAWMNGEIERQKRRPTAFRAPDRVSEARIALFRAVEDSLGEDPGCPKGRELAGRWDSLLREETGGDPEVRASIVNAWTHRRHWPGGVQQYAAALYGMDYPTFDKVVDFLLKASYSSGSQTA
jgi:DNA-binding transcriptional MerR regulator